MKLSPNFTVDQYIKSDTATRKNIDNDITDLRHLNAAKALFINIVEKLYEVYGDKLIITSGYRSQDLNTAVGGSKKSQHSKGEAIDFEVAGVSNYELAKWCKENFDFDQLILEFYQRGKPQSGWVHISYVSPEKNRKSVLTALKEGKTTTYHSGLIE
jgi:zinc D-Ala-D-Ala carboxypeptidase